MQAILCDVSSQPILGDAWEVQLIRGRVVVSDQGRPRMIQRDESNMLFLSDPVGRWMMDSFEVMRAAYSQQLPGERSIPLPLFGAS